MKIFQGIHNSIVIYRAIIALCLLTVQGKSLWGTPDVDWTVLVYVQARNNLSSFSSNNFNDMARVGSNKNLNLLVQWYKPEDHGVWRYKIDKNQLVLDAHLPSPTDGNSVQDLTGAMHWAVTNYPAKKYCLILWNHGVGVLDPEWGRSTMQINKKYFGGNPRIQIEGITIASDEYEQDTLLANMLQGEIHRGILFNEQSKTYMNNQMLATALQSIKNDILGGKKLDIIGMDACLMGMVEVAYQVRECADFMVTSQEVELAYGWNYLGWLQDLSKQVLSPIHVAKSIVQAYESLYKPKISFYTQSAVDLSKVTHLKKSIDLLAMNMMACYAAENLSFGKVIRQARQNCQQFSSASYVDLYSFMSELSKELKSTYNYGKNDQYLSEIMKTTNVLGESLEIAMKNVEETVVANVVGQYLSQARGISIYFPRYVMEASYEKTAFATDGLWSEFLKHAFVNGVRSIVPQSELVVSAQG